MPSFYSVSGLPAADSSWFRINISGGTRFNTRICVVFDRQVRLVSFRLGSVVLRSRTDLREGNRR